MNIDNPKPKTHLRDNLFRPVSICGLESEDAEILLDVHERSDAEISAIDIGDFCETCHQAWMRENTA